MTAFPKYPYYKPSGIEWLGDVPEHWEVEKARWMFRKLERPVQKDDGIVTSFRDGQVALRSRRREEGYTMAILEQGYQAVRKGELVVNGMDAFAGAIGVSEDDGKCTPEYSVLAPTRPDINNHYFAHLLRVMAARGYIHIICPSVRERAPRFRFPKLQDSRFPIPPRAEQDRIVAFLDEKAAQIDALIAKKQRQIELLDEQKAILINRAVTRGLHPQAELQDSGIPWIGQIPKGWKPVPLRRLVHRIEQGVSPSTVEGDVGPEDWGVMKSGCTNGGVFRQDEHKRLPKRFKIDPSIVVKTGDLLVSRACGSRDLVASTALVEELRYNLILSDKNFRLVLGDKVLPQFLCHSMNSWHYRRQIEPRISGAEGLPNNIPSSKLVEVVIPLPDLQEQEAIVTHLDSLRHSFSKLIQQLESQIQTLQTLRSTLIAHAVTGKIKV